jgi:hypothetical protein
VVSAVAGVPSTSLLLVFPQFWGVTSASPDVPVIYCDASCYGVLLLLLVIRLLTFLECLLWQEYLLLLLSHTAVGVPSPASVSEILGVLTLLLYLLCCWCTCCYQVPVVVNVSAVAGKPAVALVPALAVVLEN